MLRLGITGGIASGKSVVASMLRELQFHVLDADRLAHQLTEPGQPAYREVVQEFGSEILAANQKMGQRIDRAKLAAVVFPDRARLARLNAIVHPRVEEAIFQQFSEWQRSGAADAVFVEAALLVEAGYHKFLDGLIVAWCKPEQQLERLIARGLTESEARKRIASQMPVEEKLHYATERIDCSGSFDETREQVGTLAAKLRHQPSKS
jgi:dephospho-CoA kinase